MADLSKEFYGESGEMIAKITKAVRTADQEFKDIGGSTRHWVRECLLSALKEEGLRIVQVDELMKVLKPFAIAGKVIEYPGDPKNVFLWKQTSNIKGRDGVSISLVDVLRAHDVLEALEE